MHEQSETIQLPNGSWVNVYGRNTPQAGQQLPGTPAYRTVDEAVSAAKARSEQHGREHQEKQQPRFVPVPQQGQPHIPIGPPPPADPAQRSFLDSYLDHIGYGDVLKAITARMGNEQDEKLRNDDHAAFSRMLMNLVGAPAPAMSPLYSGAKLAAQSGLPGSGMLNAASTKMGLPLASPTTSPPSMGEVYAGLSPLDPRNSVLVKLLMQAMSPGQAEAQP